MPEELRQEVSEQNRIPPGKAARFAGRGPRPLPPHPLQSDPSLQGNSGELRGAGWPDRLHRRPHDVAPRDGQGQLRPRARPRRPDPDLRPPRRCRRGSLTSSSRTSTSATSSALKASFPHEDGRGQRPRAEGHAAHQVPASPAGEVPGLKDMDTRYRQRYLDMIVNPEVRDTSSSARRSSRPSASSWTITATLRSIPPVLGTLEIGAAARPFVTPTTTRWILICICASRRNCT